MSQKNRYLLDSDILVEYLRNQPQAIDYIDSLEGELLTSVITVAELIAGARNQTERKSIELFLSAMIVNAIDYAIARQGGLYRQQYKQSHGTGLDDALIAATPGIAFGDSAEGHVRFSIATHNSDLEKMVERMAKLVPNL